MAQSNPKSKGFISEQIINAFNETSKKCTVKEKILWWVCPLGILTRLTVMLKY